jgi:hypothetical protein
MQLCLILSCDVYSIGHHKRKNHFFDILKIFQILRQLVFEKKGFKIVMLALFEFTSNEYFQSI